MNSFNHYSLGSCIEWLYTYVLGIKLAPGTEKVVISPSFSRSLGYAKGKTHLSGGRISVSWRHKKNLVRLEVEADEGVNYDIDCGMEPIAIEKSGNVTVAVFEP